ncbi:hypothetical protein HK407_03g06170 [Ordospora pajunii]|uniref:uncharacterized protein n=1 Tax=Ordospora pajunii TaxID=3039483 RepID=UPI00295271CE|nr:uncharacterized protein HK407_03g06170 [Ordospora pajunii]KAH9411865.1 hypothetical protein HK407_03g06170 [Ordospora pajunii]
MDILKEFIELNVCTTGDFKGAADGVKKAIAGMDLLVKVEVAGEVEASYLKYVQNLCVTNPVVFDVSPELNGLERACMMISFDDYEHIDLSMYCLRHEIVGCVPSNNGVGDDDPVLIVRCKGSLREKMHVYCAREYVFYNEMAESLSVKEQCVLLVEMIRIANLEKCEDLRRLKVQAYIDRIMFPANENSAMINRIVDYYRIKIMGEVLEPEFAMNGLEADLEHVFEFPHVFRCDVELQMGEMYFNDLSYAKALGYFEKYHDIIKTIKCLAALNRNEEAIGKARMELRNLKGNAYSNRIKACNLMIILGEMTGNENYFDEAFEVYRSYEPLKAKGMFFFRSKQFEKAICAFEQTLKLVPHNVEVQFVYACSLTSALRFEEATDVYEKLVADDQKNVMFLRNLAMCRIQLDDMNKGLSALKEAARYDGGMMQAYLLMCIKYKIEAEIRYSLERVSWFDELEAGLMYVVQEKILSIDEVLFALKRNARIREEADELIKKVELMSAG